MGWGAVVVRLEEVDVDGTSFCGHCLFGVGGSESESDSGSEAGQLLSIGLSVVLTAERIQS